MHPGASWPHWELSAPALSGQGCSVGVTATGHARLSPSPHTGLKDHGALAAAILVPFLLLVLCVICCCCGAGSADARDRYFLTFFSL